MKERGKEGKEGGRDGRRQEGRKAKEGEREKIQGGEVSLFYTKSLPVFLYGTISRRVAYKSLMPSSPICFLTYCSRVPSHHYNKFDLWHE